MAATSRRHPLFILFLLLMALLCVAGIALMVYGSMTNGIPGPRLPGLPPLISRGPHG